MSILGQIKEHDFGLFHQLYAVLIAFADDPNNVISRIGGGRISIPEDQAGDLDHFYRAILANYPGAEDLEVMKLAARIDKMLEDRSAGGELFDPTFWKNSGFLRHPDWLDIRDLVRAFLFR